MGISIGLTRLFWQLREAGLVAGVDESSVQAMVALMEETQLTDSLDIARERGVRIPMRDGGAHG